MEIFKKLGIDLSRPIPGASTGREWFGSGNELETYSPIDGAKLGTVKTADGNDYERVMSSSVSAGKVWRGTPAPARGEIVRQIGQKLREYKEDLAVLITTEMGKIITEGRGEVQEMIDMCDFAVGQSRQLYGLTIVSERPEHRMMEQYHPLGVVGVISAFNFPAAVWSWNAMLGAVCGDTIVWKPSSKVPLVAIACQKIAADVAAENGFPDGIFSLLIGGGETIGDRLSSDKRVPLVSMTGSTEVGRRVGETVAGRFGRTILELGGNNAVIVTPSANLDLAVPGIVFGAAGTAGQRCTSIRRVIIHESIYDKTAERLKTAFSSLRIGNPLDPATHVGPVIDKGAAELFRNAVTKIESGGGNRLIGGKELSSDINKSGCYVEPVIFKMDADMPMLQTESFVPILYLVRYSGGVENAIAIQNNSVYGLSSSIYTDSFTESETFLSAFGSDCGIANVNIGTSGAEIGGAFGGEKATGGGRESGSDAWKGYMRRQTNTISRSSRPVLAQGVDFGG